MSEKPPDQYITVKGIDMQAFGNQVPLDAQINAVVYVREKVIEVKGPPMLAAHLEAAIATLRGMKQ